MESFALLRKHLAMYGICLQQSPQKHPFNAKNTSVLIVISLGIMSYANQLHKINNFAENADVVYDIVSCFFCHAIFTTIVSKTPKLFRLIDDFEDVVKNSE